jgi:hypothetical protein
MFKLGSRSSWAVVRLGYGAADRQPQAPASLLGARAGRGEAALHHNALHPSALEYERSRRWRSGQRGPAVLPPAPPVRGRVVPMTKGSPLARGLASRTAHMARLLLHIAVHSPWF